MTQLERALVTIVEDLVALEVRFAMVGGLAVSARVEPRTTRDVDLVVAAAGDQAERQLVATLQQRGYELKATVEQPGAGRLATARFVARQSRRVFVDLLFASSGIEPEIVAAAETLEVLPGLSVPVATRAHLVALKLLARDDRQRPQDWDDLRRLLADATAGELAAVRAALALIDRRGFARQRDLAAQLDSTLRDLAYATRQP